MSEPRDSSDLDAIEECRRSRGFSLIMERIAEQLEARRRALETDIGEAQTWKLRGQIRALGIVLEIPQILHNEIAQKLKEEE